MTPRSTHPIPVQHVVVVQAFGLYNNRPNFLHFPWESPTFAIGLQAIRNIA